ncbi:MAG: alpha/beta fold hydrolase [Acidimicrobiales bacterium]
MTEPVDCRVEVAPGVSLRVLCWPEPEGTPAGPVLCVHGLASNARTWDGVADRLHDLGHPVAAVDLRGHGHSDAPDDGYDFTTLGADILAVLDALGWERAALAGQSTGGNLVVHLGARQPARVRGVAGIDGGAFDLQRRWPEWEACEAALAPPRIEGTPADALERSLRRSHPDWSDAGVAATMANFEVRPDGTVRPWLRFDHHLQILRGLWEHRPSEDLAAIEGPVLLVLADTGDDWSVAKRAEADVALAALPAVAVRWLSPADHDMHVQQPDVVAGLLHDAFGRG